MVKVFKLTTDPVALLEITEENIADLIGNRFPWYQRIQRPAPFRHFGVCPYCNNVIQIVGTEDGEGPLHGRHLGLPLHGFDHFDREMLESCPAMQRNRNNNRADRRGMSELGRKIRRIAIDNFDHVVTILSEDFSIPISRRLALSMLSTWLQSNAFLYTGAHLRNIPWMIAFHAQSESLFGQNIEQIPRLVEAIRERVPQAGFADGRLVKGTGWYQIELATPRHRKSVVDFVLLETVEMRIKDYTIHQTAEAAPNLYARTIPIQPERFEALINSTEIIRNRGLLNDARELSERYETG